MAARVPGDGPGPSAAIRLPATAACHRPGAQNRAPTTTPKAGWHRPTRPGPGFQLSPRWPAPPACESGGSKVPFEMSSREFTRREILQAAGFGLPALALSLAAGCTSDARRAPAAITSRPASSTSSSTTTVARRSRRPVTFALAATPTSSTRGTPRVDSPTPACRPWPRSCAPIPNICCLPWRQCSPEPISPWSTWRRP